MRERQRRARASAATMRSRFPDITTLRIGFEFRDRGPFAPVPQMSVMHPPASAYFVFPCPYADCDGEFDISAPVESLAATGESRCHGELNCTGHRRVDTGQVPCGLTARYAIEALRD